MSPNRRTCLWPACVLGEDGRAYKTLEDQDSKELEEAQCHGKIAAEKAAYDEYRSCIKDLDIGNWMQCNASNNECELGLQAASRRLVPGQ